MNGTPINRRGELPAVAEAMSAAMASNAEPIGEAPINEADSNQSPLDKAIIIITDRGFLVPSLVLALQIKSSKARGLADIIIFLVDMDNEPGNLLNGLSVFSEITFIHVSSAVLNLGPEALSRFGGHVPVNALMRLVIYKHIPEHYHDIIYIDGDMQLFDDISALIRQDIPEGHIAACVENFILREDDQGNQPAWLNSYLTGLGLTAARQYFNSGLLAFKRTTWETIGSQALDFFKNNPGACKHHDQSALNAVCNGKWLPLSPAYNVHTFFLRFFKRRIIRPHLVHFSSSPKPWQSPESPWPASFVGPYREIIKKHPFLSEYINVYAEGETKNNRLVKYIKEQAGLLADRHGYQKKFVRYMSSTNFYIQ